MDAKICDRCGAMWKDCEDENNVNMNYLCLSKGGSHSDRIGEYDLCDDCYEGLFRYLKEPKTRND